MVQDGVIRHNLRGLLVDLWSSEIKEQFLGGKVTYERQLQSLLYYHIRKHLDPKYTIWVEPVIYFKDPSDPNEVLKGNPLNKAVPDLIITNDEVREVVAIFELKFTPWNFVSSTGDLRKLLLFEEESREERKILLGWKPISSEWISQEGEGELFYRLNQDILYGFFVCSKPGSEALNEIEESPSNFIHLTGYIRSPDNVVFKEGPVN